jgi:hypothetical protein
MDASRTEIQTFSGRRIDPLVPDPTQIVIEDIAHALANQCRFGGHCLAFYSVAQHSALLADLVGNSDLHAQLWALLHDAAEAYLVDLPRPLKHHSTLGASFRMVEEPLQRVILKRFGLASSAPPDLKEIDLALLAAEKRVLVASGWEWPELAGVKAAPLEISPWLPERATHEFLSRFERIEELR